MFDKKTIGLLLGMVGLVLLIYLLSKAINLNQFFPFLSEQLTTQDSTSSGRTGFSELIETPTPTPT